MIKHHILIAEDDEDDRMLIHDAFSAQIHGFNDLKIDFFSDGDALMQALLRSANLPTIILLDLNMPKKDGRETLYELKNNNRFKHIPVIILTTSSAVEDIRTSYLQGSNTYFTKPVNFDGLVEIISIIKTYWLECAALAR